MSVGWKIWFPTKAFRSVSLLSMLGLLFDNILPALIGLSVLPTDMGYWFMASNVLINRTSWQNIFTYVAGLGVVLQALVRTWCSIESLWVNLCSHTIHLWFPFYWWLAAMSSKACLFQNTWQCLFCTWMIYCKVCLQCMCLTIYSSR